MVVVDREVFADAAVARHQDKRLDFIVQESHAAI